MRAQRLERIEEIRIARGDIDRLVEATDQRVVLADLLIRHASIEQRGVPGAEFGGVVGKGDPIGMAGGQRGCLRLETGPHLVQRIDVGIGDVGDDEASPAFVVEKTLGDEPAECLANWGSRHPEPRGLFDLEKRAAWTEHAVEDLRPQLIVGTASRTQRLRRHRVSVYTGARQTTPTMGFTEDHCG